MSPTNKTPSASTAAPSLNELKFKVTEPTRKLLETVNSSITDAIEQSLDNMDFSDRLDKLDKFDKLDRLDEIDGKLDDIRTMLQSAKQDLATIKDNYDQLKNAITTIEWEDE